MRFGVFLFFLIFSLSSNSHAFSACSFYFSSLSNGKNAPLSKMMQDLREDTIEIDSVVNFAKSNQLTEEVRDAVYDKNILRFLETARLMHERHAEMMAPSRVMSLPPEKRDSYLRMYSEYTLKFYEMAQQLVAAYETRNWEMVDTLLMEIHSFTAKAHQKVDSSSGF